MAMPRYDIMSGPLSAHRLPFEPHVLEGEGVLRKIWVQPPFSAKTRGSRRRPHSELLYRKRHSKCENRNSIPALALQMLEKQSQSPSFAVAEKPVRFLCPITVHTQLLESCFHESAHPAALSTATQDVVAAKTRSSRFHESAHPPPPSPPSRFSRHASLPFPVSFGGTARHGKRRKRVQPARSARALCAPELSNSARIVGGISNVLVRSGASRRARPDNAGLSRL